MTCPHPDFCKAVAHAYKRKSDWNILYPNIVYGRPRLPVVMWPPGPIFIGCTFNPPLPKLSVESGNVTITVKDNIVMKNCKRKRNMADLAWAILGCVGLLVVVLALLSRHG